MAQLWKLDRRKLLNLLSHETSEVNNTTKASSVEEQEIWWKISRQFYESYAGSLKSLQVLKLHMLSLINIFISSTLQLVAAMMMFLVDSTSQNTSSWTPEVAWTSKLHTPTTSTTFPVVTLISNRTKWLCRWTVWDITAAAEQCCAGHRSQFTFILHSEQQSVCAKLQTSDHTDWTEDVCRQTGKHFASRALFPSPPNAVCLQDNTSLKQLQWKQLLYTMHPIYKKRKKITRIAVT